VGVGAVLYMYDVVVKSSRSLSHRLISFLFVTGYRTEYFIVGLTDVSPAITAPTVWNYDVCAQYPDSVGDGDTVYLRCTSCMPPRRYLIVQLENTTYLNFCEIEVYVRGKLCHLTRKQKCKTDNSLTTEK